MIHIYTCDDKYLYEIIEDYKIADNKERTEIFCVFCSQIWSSSNKRRVYTKSIKYNVNKNLLYTDLGRIFDTWSNIEYKYYKAMTKEEDWCSLIRQKINNIYTQYFDPGVILNKEYMDLLKTPKALYYEWISGTDMEPSQVTKQIDTSIDHAIKMKEKLIKEKMSLSWAGYKKVIESFLLNSFNNCIPINEYENPQNIISHLNFLTEDHYYVGYITKCLDGEIKKWQKRYYDLPQSSRKGYKRCKSCGALIIRSGNKKMYCDNCRRNNDLSRFRKYNKKRTTNRK